MTKTREATENRSKQRSSRISATKLLEVAFWGTVFWGIGRLVLHFLHFTPYGLGTYAGLFLNKADAKTPAGTLLGVLTLFLATFLASLVYSLLLGRTRIWWSGLLFGAILFVVFGAFFGIENWKNATLATESTWFLSFGLFVGMTLSLEQSDL
jgi:hypothetical protein